MSELNNLAQKENINLDDCIVFTKDGGDILAVNIAYVGIKQRQDKMMGVNFSISPKKVKELEEFFSDLTDGQLLFYNISQTGHIPVNYRGLSTVSKKISTDPEAVFQISLLVEPAQDMPKQSYFDPTCECCTLHHIL